MIRPNAALIILGTSLALSGCSGSPPPASTSLGHTAGEAPTPAASTAPSASAAAARIPTLDTQERLDALLESSCPFASVDGRSIACFESAVEMGFATISLVVLDVASGSDSARYRIYNDGNTGLDPAKLDQEGIAAGNAHLQRGGFVSSGRLVANPTERAQVASGQLSVQLGEDRLHRGQTPAPALRESDRVDGFTGDLADCLTWDVTAVWHHPEQNVAAVLLWLHWHWKDDPSESGHTCYVARAANAEGFNDETVPGRQALAIVSLTGSPAPSR